MVQQGIWAKKITIDGVALSITSSASGIYAEAAYGVPVEEGDETVNIINGAELNIVSSRSAAISAKEILIDGSTVTATGSEGLYAGGDISITSSKVTATGTDGNAYSTGIYSNTGNVAISDGEVTATGGEAVSADGSATSLGIYAELDVTVTGGTVTATGGAATGAYAYSDGIYSDMGNVIVRAGDLNAAGGTAESTGLDGFATSRVSTPTAMSPSRAAR